MRRPGEWKNARRPLAAVMSGGLQEAESKEKGVDLEDYSLSSSRTQR